MLVRPFWNQKKKGQEKLMRFENKPTCSSANSERVFEASEHSGANGEKEVGWQTNLPVNFLKDCKSSLKLPVNFLKD